ncbi:MAG: hypothetical protein HYS81_00140 [Candidatus Aenigmatarchaeota archaeon]|nr:MAG: hypothetical protein HYS81_00140 [Candidatus Aenigmarchaeota archaeon]
MAKKMMDMGASCCSCGCPHHKWAPAFGLIVAGGVYLYTVSWGWTIIALGAMKLLGGFCKCCNC